MLEIYSLGVEPITGIGMDSETALKIDSLLDSERLKIVRRMSSNSSGCATARGTGLLLQYAGQRFLEGKCRGGLDFTGITDITVDELLNIIAEPVDFAYRHGEDGKPYWSDSNMPYFNVSHSAGTVLLAISDVEVGIDIQKIRGKNELSMAKRFYSGHEAEIIAESYDESEEKGREIFYMLWARKEALGKRTGRGVRPYLDTDVSDIDNGMMKQFIWNEVKAEDYYICICR